MTDNTETPAQWLIRQFDHAQLAGRTVVTQPMLKLKSNLDAGHPMRVTAADYRQPGRCWL